MAMKTLWGLFAAHRKNMHTLR